MGVRQNVKGREWYKLTDTPNWVFSRRLAGGWFGVAMRRIPIPPSPTV